MMEYQFAMAASALHRPRNRLRDRTLRVRHLGNQVGTSHDSLPRLDEDLAVGVPANVPVRDMGREFANQVPHSELLTEAVERGHGMGLKNLLAFVFRDNEASMKLFDRLEFQTWGVLPGVVDMDGSDLDVVILGRRLENPTSSREAGRMGLER
ncbi:MAG: hypothetical protein IIC82_05320 [Chloroflexi bacterium]|nr:hypothetical protein [Chloroflexota bacterium]